MFIIFTGYSGVIISTWMTNITDIQMKAINLSASKEALSSRGWMTDWLGYSGQWRNGSVTLRHLYNVLNILKALVSNISEFVRY